MTFPGFQPPPPDNSAPGTFGEGGDVPTTDSVPPELASSLQTMYGPASKFDFSALDQAALLLARERALAIGRRRRVHRFIGRAAAVAAAAGLALAAVIIPRLGEHPHRAPLAIAPAPAARPGAEVDLLGDVNDDGSVDIIDALLVARQVETGPAPVSALLNSWDFNRDGVIDAEDAADITSAAVSLHHSAPSSPEGRG